MSSVQEKLMLASVKASQTMKGQGKRKKTKEVIKVEDELTPQSKPKVQKMTMKRANGRQNLEVRLPESHIIEELITPNATIVVEALMELNRSKHWM